MCFFNPVPGAYLVGSLVARPPGVTQGAPKIEEKGKGKKKRRKKRKRKKERRRQEREKTDRKVNNMTRGAPFKLKQGFQERKF